MKTDLYKKVEKFVIKKYLETGRKTYRHHMRMLYWIKRLRPDADEELLIAGVSHDIGRLGEHRSKNTKFLKGKKGFQSKKALEHQQIGAEIIGKFLRNHGADEKLIKRVKMLVSKHEVGGNKDQNLVKDADSLSFFENNINKVIQLITELGKKKVGEKINWMYNRITSAKARQIARPYYRGAIKKIKGK